MDLFAYTSYSLGDDGSTSVSYNQFRGDVIRLIEKSQAICNQTGFDEKDYAIVGERTKKTYQLGDEVIVMVKNTDLEKRHLDFTLIGKKE